MRDTVPLTGTTYEGRPTRDAQRGTPYEGHTTLKRDSLRVNEGHPMRDTLPLRGIPYEGFIYLGPDSIDCALSITMVNEGHPMRDTLPLRGIPYDGFLYLGPDSIDCALSIKVTSSERDQRPKILSQKRRSRVTPKNRSATEMKSMIGGRCSYVGSVVLWLLASWVPYSVEGFAQEPFVEWYPAIFSVSL
jgi:hypothetical protein